MITKAAAAGPDENCLVKEGPTQKIKYTSTTTMASSLATRLVAARALNANDDLRIGMRAVKRIALAPSEGGGRATAVRTAPKMHGILIDENTTCVAVFAKLLS
eukprot:1691846-Pleurochrysis_carterae.AAC.1